MRSHPDIDQLKFLLLRFNIYHIEARYISATDGTTDEEQQHKFFQAQDITQALFKNERKKKKIKITETNYTRDKIISSKQGIRTKREREKSLNKFLNHIAIFGNNRLYACISERNEAP